MRGGTLWNSVLWTEDAMAVPHTNSQQLLLLDEDMHEVEIPVRSRRASGGTIFSFGNWWLLGCENHFPLKDIHWSIGHGTFNAPTPMFIWELVLLKKTMEYEKGRILEYWWGDQRNWKERIRGECDQDILCSSMIVTKDSNECRSHTQIHRCEWLYVILMLL